jgi:GntR family transcriptional regulator/MocR family aminotransferase
MLTHLRKAGLTTIHLDPADPRPLYQQMYEKLRQLILASHIPAGTQMPSTRVLAQELGVSRNTVLAAFSQLASEGYLTSRAGAGSFVADPLPDDMFRARRATAHLPQIIRGVRTISEQGSRLRQLFLPWVAWTRSQRALAVGVPALDAFPYAMWSRLLAARWRRPLPTYTAYGGSAGFLPLREAIAEYLVTARGVKCTPDQVIVTNGSQQALDLASRVLLDPGDAAWLEEPGYIGARLAFLGAGARVVPVPVDAEGMSIAAGERLAPSPRVIYATPSRHFPLGGTMSLARRLRLLAFATERSAWIIEDDYDSEFRYAGRPLPSLQGLDVESRVLYVGTFSKVLLPALRLGYLVVPTDLVDAFLAARSIDGLHAPVIDQMVVTDFMVGGHFARHLRRMRALYAQRQEALLRAIAIELDDELEVRPEDAGMHLVAYLRRDMSDEDACQLAATQQVTTLPLSRFYMQPAPRQALMLGYTGFRPPQINRAARQLALALRRPRAGDERAGIPPAITT